MVALKTGILANTSEELRKYLGTRIFDLGYCGHRRETDYVAHAHRKRQSRPDVRYASGTQQRSTQRNPECGWIRRRIGAEPSRFCAGWDRSNLQEPRRSSHSTA